MRFEFYVPAPAPSATEGNASAQPDAKPDPPVLVGSAAWNAGEVTVESDDARMRERLVRAFRHTPVVTDDAAYRRFGTHGQVQIQPGDLEWFRAAAQVRATQEAGVTARLIPGIAEGGFDPAAGYRTFEDSIERLGSEG